MDNRLVLRPMTHADIPAVLEVAEGGPEAGWGRAVFARAMRRRYCRVLASRADGRVLGYLVYDLCGRRFDVLALTIRAECRRAGLGRALLGHLTAKVDRRAWQGVWTLVAERDLGGQLFLRGLGFRWTRTHADPAGGDAMYQMEYRPAVRPGDPMPTRSTVEGGLA